ncbi:MAG: sigma-70 family RNA polymerase sigma factor [Acidobacteriia bacterium]|nr:sigma-70 family RNA polymerase sigma factor [Terriglobia bacterium]
MAFTEDTWIGGNAAGFPATRASLIQAASQTQPALAAEAMSAVIEAYWKPVYKYIRVKWKKGNEQAKDLTQGFFASAIERNLLSRFDASKAAFRTYLRTCVDGYVMHQFEAEMRLKRGGDTITVPLDFDDAERELTLCSAEVSPEEVFHREWLRELFSQAIADLGQLCQEQDKLLYLQLFNEYDLAEPDARPTYEQLAGRHQIPVTAVTNYLAWARRNLRSLLLDRLAGITSGQRELEQEARFLLDWEGRR